MPKASKIVVLGTGELAIPAVEALRAGGHDIARILVRPKRTDDDTVLPEERRGSLLAAWAEAQGIEVRRPSQPGSDEVRDSLAALEPDLGVIVSYGRSFPLELLEVPKRGWVKLHFSALPKYRGHHAIRAAIAAGDRSIGVSVIEVTDQPDGGPIYAGESVDIEKHEDFGVIAPRVAKAGAEQLAATVQKLMAGKKLKQRKQNDRRATTAVRFSQRHLRPPWWLGPAAVYNRLRALSPEPGMTSLIQRSRVRITKGSEMQWVVTPNGDVGSFLGLRVGRLAVLCDSYTVFGIERLELADGTKVNASTFVRDIGLQVGDRVL